MCSNAVILLFTAKPMIFSFIYVLSFTQDVNWGWLPNVAGSSHWSKCHITLDVCVWYEPCHGKTCLRPPRGSVKLIFPKVKDTTTIHYDRLKALTIIIPFGDTVMCSGHLFVPLKRVSTCLGSYEWRICAYVRKSLPSFTYEAGKLSCQTEWVYLRII